MLLSHFGLPIYIWLKISSCSYVQHEKEIGNYILLQSLLHWMFAYDRTNYARYLPVYWIEMSQLPTTYPYIYNELIKGHFGVQRQDSHGFAQVACDMTIEQTVNRDTKTSRGVKSSPTTKE